MTKKNFLRRLLFVQSQIATKIVCFKNFYLQVWRHCNIRLAKMFMSVTRNYPDLLVFDLKNISVTQSCATLQTHEVGIDVARVFLDDVASALDALAVVDDVAVVCDALSTADERRVVAVVLEGVEAALAAADKEPLVAEFDSPTKFALLEKAVFVVLAF